MGVVALLGTLLAVGLAGCTGIDRSTTEMIPDGPLGISLVTEGGLTRGGATWTMTIDHGGGSDWGEVSFDAACDGPLEVRLWAVGEPEQVFNRSPGTGIDVTRFGPPLAWRVPPVCDEPASMQLLKPGDSTEHSWHWDATLWNETSNAFEDAPEGGYVWEAVWHGRHVDAAPDATGEDAQLTPRVVEAFTFTR